MTLQYATQFIECESCGSKPGAPALCHPCLERRELYSVVERLRKNTLLDRVLLKNLVTVCPTCNGAPKQSCLEHGR